jgi:hypothetical protein
VDGAVEWDRLRLGELVVRLNFLHHRQGTDPNRLEVADAAGGPDTKSVFAKFAISRNLDGRLDQVVFGVELRDLKAGRITHDLRGVGQAGAAEAQDDLGAALPATRVNGGQYRGRSKRERTTEAQRTQR